ncbi:glycosyltransferase family 4 protein [Martelella sp. FOR1707]
MSGYFFQALVCAFFVSAAICALIVSTRKFHLRFSDRRKDTKAVQSAHRVPTPRIGGVAILVALVSLGMFIPDTTGHHLWLLLPSLMPVFLAGLAEDLGFHVSPRRRLIAAAVSSLLAVVLFKLWIPRADIPLIGTIIAFSPFAIAVTIFGGAGICNAFNLVDGVNGLSSLIAVVVAAALAAIAAQNGLFEVSAWCAVAIGALLGFLVFNFPLGKIFLGDAGAYGIGHILAWLAFLILNFIPNLTPWALLLIFFWPIADTLLAIFRRRIAGRPADQPDRLHFHQLVMRALEIGVLGRNARHISNPMTTVILAPMFTAPAIAGVIFWHNPAAAALALAFFAALFVATYQFGARFAACLRLQAGHKVHFNWTLHPKRLSHRKDG